MKVSQIILLEEVKHDLLSGKKFYDLNKKGIGSYFFDSIISDIESLLLNAGIHSKQHNLFRMIASKFPYAIYYDIKGENVIIVAVLDMRRNPAWIFKNLKERK